MTSVAAFLKAHSNPDPVARFEEEADLFYRETGIMAPGKSLPFDWTGRWTDEERRKAWNEWYVQMTQAAQKEKRS